MQEEVLDRLWSQLSADSEAAILTAAPAPSLSAGDEEIPVDDMLLLKAVLETEVRQIVDAVMDRSWVPPGTLDELIASGPGRRRRRSSIALGQLLEAAALEAEETGASIIAPVHLLLALLSFHGLDSAAVLEDVSISYFRLQRRMRVMRLD